MDDVITSGLAALARCRHLGGLDTAGWRAVRDAGAALERLDRELTAEEAWMVESGRRVARWLGPAENGREES